MKTKSSFPHVSMTNLLAKSTSSHVSGFNKWEIGKSGNPK